MNISISTSNFIIGAVVEDDNFRISDFLLRKVQFLNDTEKQIEIFELVFELFAVNKPIKKISYFGSSLAARFANGKENCVLSAKEEYIIRNEHFVVVHNFFNLL